ncbi:hypothetical protein NTH44_003667 [Vibrio metoecus]
MKKSVLFLLIAASPLALASVDSIKNNYRKYALISDSFTNSSDKPGYQVATAPNVNWKPRLNLDNATGSPSIDLSNATGDIGNTGGVNQAVKNHVAAEIAKIKPTTPTPPPTPTGWQTIYSGSGTNSIPISGSYSQWRATVVANGQSSVQVAGTPGMAYSASFYGSYSYSCGQGLGSGSTSIQSSVGGTASGTQFSINSAGSVGSTSMRPPSNNYCSDSGSRTYQATGVKILRLEVYR